MYNISVPQIRQRRKTQFSTVVPMRVATIEQRNPRPQIVVCPGCNGTRQLQYVNPDTLEIESMPCLFCNETGRQIRNASHTEHRSLLQRLAGWTWQTVKAVML